MRLLTYILSILLSRSQNLRFRRLVYRAFMAEPIIDKLDMRGAKTDSC